MLKNIYGESVGVCQTAGIKGGKDGAVVAEKS